MPLSALIHSEVKQALVGHSENFNLICLSSSWASLAFLQAMPHPRGRPSTVESPHQHNQGQILVMHFSAGGRLQVGVVPTSRGLQHACAFSTQMCRGAYQTFWLHISADCDSIWENLEATRLSDFCNLQRSLGEWTVSLVFPQGLLIP